MSVFLNEIMIALKRTIYYLVTFTLLLLLFVIIDNLDDKYNIGLIGDNEIMRVYYPLSFFLSFIIVFPSIREDFLARFLVNKKKWKQSIILSIIIGACLAFLTSLSRYIPYHFFDYMIPVGSNQVTILEGASNIGVFLSSSVTSPFLEELFFRYLLYGGLAILLSEIIDFKWAQKLYQQLFVTKSLLAISIWLLLTTTIFAMSHGTSIDNFHLYFIPGIVFGLLFIRYGLLSAWLVHGAFNFFTDYTLMLFFN